MNSVFQETECLKGLVADQLIEMLEDNHRVLLMMAYENL
jgi:hypothetical protein